MGPEEAYRFARGEEITAHNGMKAKLTRPLDFLMVADHAEFLGAMWKFFHPDTREDCRQSLSDRYCNLMIREYGHEPTDQPPLH